jgi:hypothetical protein
LIVNSYDEAKPIVIAEIAKSKTIGYWSVGGFFHKGHQSEAEELKKHCDYSVCNLLPTKKICDDADAKFLEKIEFSVPNITSSLLFVTNDEIGEIESLCDLVILNGRPVPPNDKISEVTEFTKTHFEDIYKSYDPTYTERKNNYNEKLISSFFSTLYYVNTYFFKFSYRICSWKEGLWRFVNEKTYPSFGCTQITTEPLRDERGICYNSREIKNLDNLGLITNGKPLITSKDETAENLQKKLYDIGWRLSKFEKYKGPLLDNHKDKGDTYIHIELYSPGSELGGIYIDGFLL